MKFYTLIIVGLFASSYAAHLRSDTIEAHGDAADTAMISYAARNDTTVERRGPGMADVAMLALSAAKKVSDMQKTVTRPPPASCSWFCPTTRTKPRAYYSIASVSFDC